MSMVLSDLDIIKKFTASQISVNCKSHSWSPDWKGIAKKFFGFVTHFDHMIGYVELEINKLSFHQEGEDTSWHITQVNG